MSDRELGKKMVEEADLALFATAYRHVTNRSLRVHISDERPDFICSWGRAKPVGVELTEVPITRTLLVRDLWSAADTKAEKMKRAGWRLPERTILVLILRASPLCEVRIDQASVLSDFKLGFKEIWAADYGGLDAYATIELFGLYPKTWFGFHPRPNRFQKPYG
jgi:hypothetical protein